MGNIQSFNVLVDSRLMQFIEDTVSKSLQKLEAENLERIKEVEAIARENIELRQQIKGDNK